MDKLKSFIELNFKDMDLNTRKYNMPTSNPAKKLLKYNKIENTNSKYISLKITKNSDLIAECRFCIIDNKIGYIHSIEVLKKYRSENIGTEIIRYCIRKLSNEVSKIYIYPTGRAIKRICSFKLDFNSVSKPDGWYLYRFN